MPGRRATTGRPLRRAVTANVAIANVRIVMAVIVNVRMANVLKGAGRLRHRARIGSAVAARDRSTATRSLVTRVREAVVRPLPSPVAVAMKVAGADREIMGRRRDNSVPTGIVLRATITPTTPTTPIGRGMPTAPTIVTVITASEPTTPTIVIGLIMRITGSEPIVPTIAIDRTTPVHGRSIIAWVTAGRRRPGTHRIATRGVAIGTMIVTDTEARRREWIVTVRRRAMLVGMTVARLITGGPITGGPITGDRARLGGSEAIGNRLGCADTTAIVISRHHHPDQIAKTIDTRLRPSPILPALR
jgi:hypothetical protein